MGLPPVEVEIQGLKELEINLKGLGDKLAKRAVRSAVNAGGTVILKAARSKAPFRRIRKLIIKRLRRVRKDVAAVKVGLAAEREGPPIGLFFELGTGSGRTVPLVKRRKANIRSVPNIFPKPFLRPAFDEKAPQAIRVIGQQLGKKLKELARR